MNSSPLYVTGRADSPVAICTLSSHTLLDQLASSALRERVAIIGPLETENLGIERLLTSLLGNPHIRWLVVCGHEDPRRRQGDALSCLFANGVTARGEIQGAATKRARLATLRPAEVDIVRQQVSLEDLQGVHDLAHIGATVDDCLARPLGPPPARPAATPEAEAIQVAPEAFRLRTLDPNGFVVILVDRAANRLLVEHYGNDGVLRHRLAGQDADSLSQALVEWELVSRLDHAAYLGRELARAEAALRLGLAYRQDAGLAPESSGA